MKKTYDRLAAGDRIRQKRNLLGFTQDEMAEKIDRAAKYYADIERGSCGMSVETLMALSEALDMSRKRKQRKRIPRANRRSIRYFNYAK